MFFGAIRALPGPVRYRLVVESWSVFEATSIAETSIVFAETSNFVETSNVVVESLSSFLVRVT